MQVVAGVELEKTPAWIAPEPLRTSGLGVAGLLADRAVHECTRQCGLATTQLDTSGHRLDRQVAPLAEARQGDGVDGLTCLAEHRHHELIPGPGTTPRAMHDHNRRHIRTPNRDFSAASVAVGGRRGKTCAVAAHQLLRASRRRTMALSCTPHRDLPPATGATPAAMRVGAFGWSPAAGRWRSRRSYCFGC